MQNQIANFMERMVPIVFLVPVGYTVFYFFPRYYNFSKYKTMQLFFLLGFLFLGILLIPMIFSKASSETTILFFFVVYDFAILFFTFYLFQRKIDSITIFFISRVDCQKLISDVLCRIGWTNIQLSEVSLGSIRFSDPNQNFSIEAQEKDDRFIITPIMNEDIEKVDTGNIRRFSLNLKYDVTKYPPATAMVAIFRRKNLKFFVILWGLFIAFQIVRSYFFPI